MLSTELEYLCRELECFLQCWNAFVRVGIPLYRDEIHSRGVECFLEGWNACDRVGIPLYRAGMLYRWVQCFLEGWNIFL
jgi:hypothetical protein